MSHSPIELTEFGLKYFVRLQEIFGGNAVSDEYGIGRHVANLFVTQTYEGQSDIHSETGVQSLIIIPLTIMQA